MGKGDRKTRRGKIYRGSFGKSRAKDPAKKKKRSSAKK
jgi:30S ribosomal protein S31